MTPPVPSPTSARSLRRLAGGVPRLAVPGRPAALAVKRGLDVAGAAVLLLVVALPLLVIAVLVRLDSPGPAFYRQPRVGRHGRTFVLWKFRTMGVGAADRVEELRSHSRDPNWLLLDEDPRVTRVGRFLRRTSLDELPQLWHVLRGEMSLVGPRPLVVEEERRMPAWARRRRAVRPGLTGLWQVRGRTSIPYEQMMALDCEYVRGWCLRLDLRLLALTVPVLLTRRGAN